MDYTSTMISRCGIQEAPLAASDVVYLVLAFFMCGIIRFGWLFRVSPAAVVLVLVGAPLPCDPVGGEELGESAYDMSVTHRPRAWNRVIVKIYYTSGSA